VGLHYAVRGTYFESCNCDAVCPCRMVGGRRGGRSTHGICFGVLSWAVEDGRVGDVDVSGLSAALVYRYSDDEPGSPWTFVLHVDERGDQEQQARLADVFLGRLGGLRLAEQPWIRKPSELVKVRPSSIERVAEGAGYRLRVGDAVLAAASRPAQADEPVACIVPGYDRPGVELHADEHVVRDPPLEWELATGCGFASDFDYRT
jgi:hypothetical protein